MGVFAAAANANERGNQIAAAINSKSAQTGVTATSDTAGKVTLNAIDGRNIAVKTTEAGYYQTGFGSLPVKADFSQLTLTSGQTVVFGGLTFTAGASGATGAQVATAFSGLTAGLSAASATAAASAAGVLAANGAFSGGPLTTGWTSGASASGVVTFTTTAASAATLVGTPGTGGAPATSRDNLLVQSKITLSTTSKEGINLGGAAAVIGLTAGRTNSAALLDVGVSSIDLTTSLGSQAALTVLDKAINTITDSRASLGAYQNRLSASISNLETSSMNLQASRSRILDTDYAKETTNLAKSQIVQQAATAMLAQANQSAQSVLALLK